MLYPDGHLIVPHLLNKFQVLLYLCVPEREAGWIREEILNPTFSLLFIHAMPLGLMQALVNAAAMVYPDR